MKKHTLIITLLATVALIAGITVWQKSRHQGPLSGPEKISLRLKWIHQGQFAGFYSAARQGFYEKNGLQVEVRAGGQDLSALKLVAAGSDTFGVWGADQLILAREKGIPVVALAVIYPNTPACFTALQSSGIKSIKDFPGHRIGMQYGTDLETVYLMMLRKVGLDRKQVTEVPVQFNFSMLLDGKVDAWPSYAINEPILAREKGFEVTVIDPSAYGVRMYADTVFATESLVRERPDLVRRFLIGTLRGWQFALENPQQAVKDLAFFEPGIDEAHQVAMVKAAIPYVRPDSQVRLGSMDLEVWREMQAALQAQGLLQKEVDLNALVNPSFVDAVQSELAK